MGLVQTDAQVERQIVGAMRNQLNQLLQKAAPRIQNRLKRECHTLIASSPEFVSLTTEGGQLRNEFGLVNQHQMEVILDRWISSIEVRVQKVRASRNGLTGGLSIQGCGLRTFRDVLDDPAASYITDKGEKIEFLKWLVLEGERTIIRGFEVRRGNRLERAVVSRTHSDIMKPNPAGKWSVPSWAVGYMDSNFLTRSLSKLDVASIVREELG